MFAKVMNASTPDAIGRHRTKKDPRVMFLAIIAYNVVEEKNSGNLRSR